MGLLSSQRTFPLFVERFAPNLPDHPDFAAKFATTALRSEHYLALAGAVRPAIAGLSVAELVGACEEWGVAVAAVKPLAETFTDPQVSVSVIG